MLKQGFIEAILQYDWPGNVRQLFDIVERCVSRAGRGEQCSKKTLAKALRKWSPEDGRTAAGSGGVPDPLQFKVAFEECEGNFSRVTRQNGWCRQTLYRLTEKWGLNLRGKGRRSRWFKSSKKKPPNDDEDGEPE